MDDPGLYRWAQPNQMILKNKGEGQQCVRQLWCQKDPTHHCWLGICREENMYQCNGLPKLGTVYSHQENRAVSRTITGYWILPTTPMSKERNCPLDSPRQNAIQGDLPQTSDLQNYKTMNLCYFPLNLC